LLNRRSLVNPFFLLYTEQHRLAFVEEELRAFRVPHPDILSVGERRVLEQILVGNEDFRGEVEVNCDTVRSGALDAPIDDLSAEGAEDGQAKLNCLMLEKTPRAIDLRYIPLTLTSPVPWPINPSVAVRRSHKAMHKPTPGTILLLYLSLIASLIASALGLPKSWGLIWIRS
jgi:hypothetical protein